jgi:hypothetical protein
MQSENLVGANVERKRLSLAVATAFTFGKLTSDGGVAPVSALTDEPDVIIRETGSAGDFVLVTRFGNYISKIVYGETLVDGDPITHNASGAAIKATAGMRVLGTCCQDGASAATGLALMVPQGPLAGGNASLWFGAGTSASPLATAAAGTKFQEMYTKSTDATGADSRGLYWKHTLAGAGASGEAGRFMTSLTAAGAVAARGIHASLVPSGSGTVTGLGAAVDATLHLPGAMGGTMACVSAEMDCEAAGSDVTRGSFFRAAIQGANGTGQALTSTHVNLFDITIPAIGSAGDGKLVDAISGDKAVTHLCRILINGAAYYLMLRNAV